MAASWKGGTRPDAAVNAASTAHMRTAVNPMSVAVVRDNGASVRGDSREEAVNCLRRVSPVKSEREILAAFGG